MYWSMALNPQSFREYPSEARISPGRADGIITEQALLLAYRRLEK
jgi:hypothetical protein